MEIELLEEIIKKCEVAMKSIESLDLYNFETARRRNYNQKCVNKAYSNLYDIKNILKNIKK